MELIIRFSEKYLFKNGGIVMSTTTIQHLEVDKIALESAKKYFKAKSDIEAIKKMVGWFKYAEEVNEAMEQVAGKGKIEKIYE